MNCHGHDVPFHGLLHRDERIRRHLVPETAGSRVNHHYNLPDTIDTHLLRAQLVKNFVYHLFNVSFVTGHAAWLERDTNLQMRKANGMPCHNTPCMATIVRCTRDWPVWYTWISQ